jgi:hypothetical protein
MYINVNIDVTTYVNVKQVNVCKDMGIYVH